MIEQNLMIERETFQTLVGDSLPKLNNVLRKMIGHKEQCEDILQDTLTKAWEKRASFQGKAEFSTWLCGIGVNTAVDFLRQQQRWRARAQVIYGAQCQEQAELGGEVFQSFQDPHVSFDVAEHIAYCFSCVGRSMEPVNQAALILREVLGLTNREAAKVLDMSESVFRQHLAAAREDMREKFDGLCALVNKDGVCYQCKGLREGFPESRRGPWLDGLENGLAFETRIKIVNAADLHTGKTQTMHDLFWKRTHEQECDGSGDENVVTDCGKDESQDN